jgi:hypothetical protein
MWTKLLVLVSRLRAAIAGSRVDEDFRDELLSHRDMLADDHRRRGATPGEANR